MTKMDCKWKVSAAAPKTAPLPASAGGGDEKTAVISDSYKSSPQDSYKSLVTGGNAKAGTAIIDELLSSDQQFVSTRNADPYQNLLDGMLYGDADPGQADAADYQQFYVPTFESVSRKSAGLVRTVDGAKGVLDQFEALEATIEGTIANLTNLLTSSNTGTAFTVDQIEAMNDYRSRLEDQLGFCRRQGDLAESHYAWAKENERVAQEKLKEDKAWWNPETEAESETEETPQS